MNRDYSGCNRTRSLYLVLGEPEVRANRGHSPSRPAWGDRGARLGAARSGQRRQRARRRAAGGDERARALSASGRRDHRTLDAAGGAHLPVAARAGRRRDRRAADPRGTRQARQADRSARARCTRASAAGMSPPSSSCSMSAASSPAASTAGSGRTRRTRFGASSRLRTSAWTGWPGPATLNALRGNQVVTTSPDRTRSASSAPCPGPIGDGFGWIPPGPLAHRRSTSRSRWGPRSTQAGWAWSRSPASTPAATATSSSSHTGSASRAGTRTCRAIAASVGQRVVRRSDDRLRRLHRSLDRPAPALRGSPLRYPGRSGAVSARLPSRERASWRPGRQERGRSQAPAASLPAERRRARPWGRPADRAPRPLPLAPRDSA